MSEQDKSQGDTRRIEVFRPGTFRALGGQTVSYSPDDVAALAESYDPESAPAPVVVGHPKTDSPAYGWVKRLEWDPQAERLYADIGDIEPAFEQAVKAGRYRKISISLFPSASPANPRPGKPYLKHVGFLGGAAPAVPGLKPVALGGDDDAITIELADPDVGLAADIFQRLRDWIIDKFGLEEAEKAVPGHYIDWLEESQRRAEEREAVRRARDADEAAPTYAAPENDTPHHTETEEEPMSKDKPGIDPEELARRERELAEREARLRREEAQQFAAALVAEGRLAGGLKDEAAELIVALESGAEAVSFADGEEQTPAEALKALLNKLPQAVAFGEAAPEGGETDAPVDFATPDDLPVDPARMELHRKALAWMRSHGSDDYDAALAAVTNA